MAQKNVKKRVIRLPKTDCRCGCEFDMEIDGGDLVMKCPRCGLSRRHKDLISRILKTIDPGEEEAGL
ncbi:MAG: hypothetical protein DRP79_04385 [Planctomycetota bacterium]|nr:MAG: hypothetical protein DRP79_04385 [Planctomycetota bacterium]